MMSGEPGGPMMTEGREGPMMSGEQGESMMTEGREGP